MSVAAQEETPLLSETTQEDETRKQAQTPLPKLQLIVILLVQLAEPLTSQVIYPFIVQFVRETGVSNEDVGFYVGLAESIFFACEVVTVFQWSRLSDRIGRRPVLLTGLSALAISMFSIGFSRTIWALVVSRGFAGMMNGNTGVMKSSVAEMTDETNVARAFSFVPIVWSTGVTIAPLLGGFLEHPYEKFPRVFGKLHLFETYPYLLPCGTIGIAVSIIALITWIFLIESAPAKTIERSLSSEEGVPPSTSPDPPPLPVKALLTKRVVVAIANYGLLAICDISYMALQPVVYSLPIELGGLGLSAPRIGVIMGSWGLLNGVLQSLFFSSLNRRIGSKRMFTTGILAFIPLYGCFPLMNRLARSDGEISTRVWAVVGLQVVLACVMDMAFGCIFIFISCSPPTRRSLGAVNGLAQLCASIVRTIGPALATSLFSVTIRHNLVDGLLVYLVLECLALVAWMVSRFLPAREWKRATE